MARRVSKKLDFEGLFQLALYAGMAYALVYVLNRMRSGIDVATEGPARFWVWLTSPAAVSNTGNVALPDGRVISVDAIAQNGGVDKLGNFSWGGILYYLVSGPSGIQRDAAGNMVAQLVVT